MRPTTIDSKKQKPRIFVGSSKETLKYAEAIKAQLQKVATVILWTDDIWTLGGTILESLISQLPDYDFAILIFGADDVIASRGVVRNAPRDNIIFELGLFMGHIGRFRTFFLCRTSTDLKIPTNLNGIQYLSFDGIQPKKAVEKACASIRREIDKQGVRDPIPSPQLSVKGPGHVGKAVLKWMYLSKGAREKLAQSQFIRIGETGDALLSLVDSAKGNDSILAICGYKGNFSKLYYKKNFEKCRAVSRVFSYEAIRSEITRKEECFALNGLEMHLNNDETNGRNVEVIFIPQDKLIKDIVGGRFDPPLSFGLAILLDGKKSPKKAIVHWEMDAEPLKDLIAIEGVIIDKAQREVLYELVKLFETISRSNDVLSYKNYQSSAAKDKRKITAVCKELKIFARSRLRGKA